MLAWCRSVALLCRDGLRGRSKLGIAAIVLVVTLAAIGLVAGSYVRGQGPGLVDEVAGEANVAHSVLFGSDEALRLAAADPEIVTAAGPYAVAWVGLPEYGDLEVRLTALEDPAIAVGIPARLEGRWLEPGANEVVLDRSLALDLGVQLGDRLALAGEASTRSVEVVGTAIDLTDCFYPECDPGRSWADESTAAALGGTGDLSLLLVRLSDASTADRLASRALTQSVPVTSTESWLDTRGDLLGVDRIFGAFLSGFGMFLLAAACVVMIGAMTARMVARRREVGLLVAVGVTPGQVVAALLAEHLVLGAVGAVAGWLLGALVTPQLQIGLGDVLPASSSLRLRDLVLALVAIEVSLAVATILPARRAAHLPPTAALREEPSQHAGGLTRLVARLGDRHPMVGLGVEELTARPLRAALSIAALALAVMGTLIAVGFVRTIDAAIADPARTGDPWDIEVAPASDLDLAAIGTTPGVATWFTETLRRSTIGEEAFLSRAIGGPLDGARYQLGAGRLPERQDEAIAGYGFLERFDVDVGDQVDFVAGAVPLRATIVGWYREAEDGGEILTYRFDQLQAAAPDVAPERLLLVVDDNTEAGAVAAALTEALGPDVDVAVQPNDNGDDLAPFRASVMIIAGLVALVAIAQFLSALVTSARERAREIGVLRTVGATSRQLRTRVAVTGLTVGSIAGAIGVPLGLGLFRAMSDAATRSIGIGPGWAPAVPWAVVLVAIPLTMLLGCVIGVVSVQGLLRKDTAALVHWE